MLVYHEIQQDKLGAVLENGIKRNSRGDKGDDPLIIKTNAFLDQRRPTKFTKLNVSRDNNIYAYVYVDMHIIDIATGRHIKLTDFISNSPQSVLQLDVDPLRCFVSDLDTFDALMQALNARDSHKAEELATSYWEKLTLLANFDADSMRRPEVMITYNVPSDKLSAAKTNGE